MKTLNYYIKNLKVRKGPATHFIQQACWLVERIAFEEKLHLEIYHTYDGDIVYIVNFWTGCNYLNTLGSCRSIHEALLCLRSNIKASLLTNSVEEYLAKLGLPQTIDGPDYEPEELTDNSIMPFGKYKGLKMSDVPIQYLNWLSKQERPEDAKNPVFIYIKQKAAIAKKYDTLKQVYSGEPDGSEYEDGSDGMSPEDLNCF